MSKILFVDDNDLRIKTIKGFLIQECSLSEDVFDIAISVESGLNALEKGFFDLIIMNQQLPRYDKGKDWKKENGKFYLDQIISNNDFSYPLRIICLTDQPVDNEDYKELEKSLKINVIDISNNDSNWLEILIEYVNKTLKFRSNLEVSLIKEKKFDVGIICALQEEFKQLLEAFDKENWIDYNFSNSLYVFKRINLSTFHMKNVKVIAACANNAGEVATATLAS